MKAALIAGRGILPYVWAKEAKARGVEILAVRLLEEADYPLEEIADRVETINIGALGRVINKFKRTGFNKVIMLGGVDRSLLLDERFKIDKTMQNLLDNLSDLNVDSIMLALINKLSKEGIEVLRQDKFLEKYLPQKGILTQVEPDEQLLSDMDFAFKISKGIAELDIGQTVLVKNNVLLAVEAIEGTDETIRRAARLGGSGIVMAKVSKPQQDFRFDIPTVGQETLDYLIEVKARGLIIEAGKTFLLEMDEFIKRAEANNIVIRAVESS